MSRKNRNENEDEDEGKGEDEDEGEGEGEDEDEDEDEGKGKGEDKTHGVCVCGCVGGCVGGGECVWGQQNRERPPRQESAPDFILGLGRVAQPHLRQPPRPGQSAGILSNALSRHWHSL